MFTDPLTREQRENIEVKKQAAYEFLEALTVLTSPLTIITLQDLTRELKRYNDSKEQAKDDSSRSTR